MNIFVNGRKASIKSGSSFDYISENRLFLGRDGYTLNIVFPLKDCRENTAIFGHLSRADVAKARISYQCEIIAGRTSLAGVLTVVKVSETEVECQFAEGKCEQTMTDPFEDVYVCNLDLGAYPETSIRNVSPLDAWRSIDEGGIAVALPWVNEKYADAPNNWVTYDAGTDSYAWNKDNRRLSWQPYLIVIAERICRAIGYEYDFTEWWESDDRFLIICNTLPASWEMFDFAKALPEWTVTEFFEKLELLLMCEFDFDHRVKSVSMRFSRNVVGDIAPVKIDTLVDSYDVEISADDDIKCDYIAAKRLAYKECSHPMSKYYACDWFVKKYELVMRYDTLAELLEKNRRRDVSGSQPAVYWGEPVEGRNNASTVPYLLYAADVDTYFVFYSVDTDRYASNRYTQVYILVPVNVFGSGSVDDDSTDTEAIEFVPACIMDTYIDEHDDMGNMLFLSLDDNDEDYSMGGSRPIDDAREPQVVQPTPALYIERGEKEAAVAFYDVVYVAYWTGHILEKGKSPCPFVDPIIVSREWKDLHFSGPSLRLAGSPLRQLNIHTVNLPAIDATQKFKFSWIDDSIPNPRAIFNIRGRRYLCEKITATFTEDGLSQLLKGEFYPLLDD
ncbi:MAG: hypothetical protein K2L73_02855 [Muribaculaceae bacterium]|nr:hypothetical protein [Muribaculaceae bacterium]